ncbi:bile acid:sodium symporter family protein [Hirschia maritima]|uniref:bile acid:sodium symporter family protein n=1 Tax=Hirschia maritima TaxID=1121961 RepID=UPI0003A35F26|nr:bile acid:sodium symporter family protein [Hirschia maritima]
MHFFNLGVKKIASILFEALPLVLAFIMFSLGLGLQFSDFARVITFPKAIIAGAIAQSLLVPFVALMLVLITKPSPEIAVGIMILSFCPGGVMSNIMTKMAGGTVALSISLTGVISLLSILTIPILVTISAGYFMGEDAISTNTTQLGIKLFVLTAAPVILGLLIRNYFSRLALKVEKYVSLAAAILFGIIALGSIIANWDVFVQNFWQLGPILILLNIILLGVGVLIGKLFNLVPADQITLSIETGVQNSALGITIGSIVMSSETGISALSLPSGIYSVTVYFVTLPTIAFTRYFLKRLTQNTA